MVELPKTEAELQGLIDEAIEKATTALKQEYDGKFAAQRTKHDSEIKKLKEDMGKSAEELAQQKLKEQQEADQKELTELRSYKKGKTIEERLGKENLPSYFKNDQRLLNANEEDFDKVVKEVKKEYEATLPRGNQTSTVVNTNTGEPSKSSTDTANEAFAQTLGQLVGR